MAVDGSRSPGDVDRSRGRPALGILRTVVGVTVFGAGTMGTAMAMHLARTGHATTLWASPFDAGVLPALRDERRHPALPEHLPDSVRVMGPDELSTAGRGADVAVMGAHSAGARPLARMVMEGCGPLPTVVAVAKGLEAASGKRMSEVYAEEVRHQRVVAIGGPCLAPELAQGLPTAAVFASVEVRTATEAAAAFRSASFHVAVTADLIGMEYCAVLKNIAAIGIGILDGLVRGTAFEYRNAKAALFTQAIHELGRVVVALGGEEGTVTGLAGIGDTLVTAIGGRNRLFGEMLGQGVRPEDALEDLRARGMTVEGWDAALGVRHLLDGTDLDLPYFAQVQRILFDGAPAASMLECLSWGEDA
jgi:glycerol-3-phosphate dehydrogenase (NAD(P)+)